MKVYVVKRIDNKYLSKYSNYDYRLENPCEPCWTEKIYNAKIFEEYDEADNFCNTIDCQIVECSFMETNDFSDYAKQVRKGVCKEIQVKIEEKARYSTNNNDDWDILIDENSFLEILDQIQNKE